MHKKGRAYVIDVDKYDDIVTHCADIYVITNAATYLVILLFKLWRNLKILKI